MDLVTWRCRCLHGQVNLIAGAGSLVIGGSGLWVSFHMLAQIRRKGHWPTVQGRVLERGTVVTGRGYTPLVRYEYAVGGETYVHDQIYLVGKTSNRQESEARKVVETLPDPLPVHYDPADPRLSYLLVTPRWWFWIFLVMSCFALLMGLVWLVAG